MKKFRKCVVGFFAMTMIVSQNIYTTCGTMCLEPQMREFIESENDIAEFSSSDDFELKIFVSLSMNKNDLKSIVQFSKKTGARIILNGLCGGDFLTHAKKISELGLSNIEVDPEEFEYHRIAVVPTFVILKKKKAKKNQISFLAISRLCMH